MDKHPAATAAKRRKLASRGIRRVSDVYVDLDTGFFILVLPFEFRLRFSTISLIQAEPPLHPGSSNVAKASFIFSSAESHASARAAKEIRLGGEGLRKFIPAHSTFLRRTALSLTGICLLSDIYRESSCSLRVHRVRANCH